VKDFNIFMLNIFINISIFELLITNPVVLELFINTFIFLLHIRWIWEMDLRIVNNGQVCM
jgi:hypothetical protein